jgi:deoxyribonuclease V
MRGDEAALWDGDELIGTVLRSRERCRPLYVSRGHRCRLADAVALVKACLAGTKLPEPTRQAHLLVNRLRRGEAI